MTTQQICLVKYPDRVSRRKTIKHCVSRIRRLRAIEHPDKYERGRLRRAVRFLRKNLADLNGLYCEHQWRALLDMLGNKCCACGGCGPVYRDHIIPVGSPGSSNHVSNLQPLCWLCNSSEGRKSVDFRPDHIKEMFKKGR